MSRSSNTGSRSHKMSAEDVLAKRVVPSAEDLISLIREVNPTGRSLTKREAEQRYATKSKLQSLLVERFAAELAVETSDQGVVLLRHRYLGMAAGHAVVTDLDEKARAWVQLQIDLGPGDEHTTGRYGGESRGHQAGWSEVPDGGPETSWDELLVQGYRALEEYDFEAARAAFHRAHEERPSDKRPVCALLDILVERLALDADALLLADSLDPDLFESAEVAAPLALAAARTGDRQRAERWAGGLEGEGAAAVHRTLAAAAIDAGDLTHAADALALARRHRPGDMELVGLEKRLAEAQALAVQSREATLAELATHEDVTVAVALAREILAEHPGSVPARKVLKDAAARAREAEQTAVLNEFRSALAEGDSKRGRALLSRAHELDINESDLKEMRDAIEQIESTARQASAEAEIQAIATRLERATLPADWETALARYASLDAEQRAEVRRRTDHKELRWFDKLEDPAHLTKVISAVLAISAGEAALSAGDPERAASCLEPHRLRLHDCKAGRVVTARVDEALEERRRAQTTSLLTRAEDAFAGGDLAQAQSLIDALRRVDVPKSLDARFEQLKRKVGAQTERSQEIGLLERHLQAGDLVRARQILVHLLQTDTTQEESDALKVRLVDVEARLRREWIVLDQKPTTLNARNAPEMSWLNIGHDDVQVALGPGGRSAIFASTHDRFVFIRVVDVVSAQIERLVMLRAPEALGYASHGLASDHFWLIGTGLHLLEISCHDWLPQRWCSLAGHVSAGQRFENGFSIPETGTVWLTTSDPPPGWVQHSHVIDIAENRLLRTASKDLSVRPIPGTSPPLVLRTAFNEAAHVVGARGAPVAELSFPKDYRVLDVARHPSGDGFLALAFREDAPEECIEIFASDQRGNMHSCASVPGIGEQPSALATVLGTGATYVAYHELQAGDMQLGCVQVQGHDVKVTDQTSTNGDCIVLQDEAASTAVALRLMPDGVDLTSLGSAAPRMGGQHPEHIDIPSYQWPFYCFPNPDEELADTFHRGFTGTFYAVPEDRRSAWAEKQAEALAEKPAGLLLLQSFLETNGLEAVADKALRMAEARYPDDPYVRLALVEHAAKEGRWTGDALLAEPVDGAIREHLSHLQGLVLLRANMPEAAIAAWEKAPSDKQCKIESLAALAKVVVAAESGAGVDAAELPDLAGLIRLIFRADECSARGDTESARLMLDRAWIRNLREMQTLARLADIYLATHLNAESPSYFRAAALLAEFLEVGAHDFRFARRLWLGERTWNNDRIGPLVVRAKAWLEEQ